MNLGWSETHVFNATTVNEVRIGYSHVSTTRLQPFGNQGGLNAANGIQGIPDSPPNGGLTQINITGLNQLGGHNNLPVDEINGNSQFHDNFSKQWGAHSLKAGFEMQRVKVAVFSAQFPHGYFAYSGQYTTVPGGNAASTGIAHFAIAPVAATVANGINFEGGANQVGRCRRWSAGRLPASSLRHVPAGQLGGLAAADDQSGGPLGILSAAARRLRRGR